MNGSFWALNWGSQMFLWSDTVSYIFCCWNEILFARLLHCSFVRQDIIHCHDWSSAPVAWLFKEQYTHYGLSKSRIVFTIHNLEFGADLIGRAMTHADKATTVSASITFTLQMAVCAWCCCLWKNGATHTPEAFCNLPDKSSGFEFLKVIILSSFLFVSCLFRLFIFRKKIVNCTPGKRLYLAAFRN